MRFSGFDDEWKTYKLKDLLHNKSSSISINQLDDNVGNYPLYGASGFLKCIDFYEMDSDYISIVKDGSGVGNISFHEKNTSVVNTSQYILPKENLNIHFIFYLLQTINLNKYKTGSTIPHIYFKDYSIEKVKIPKYDEQKKIGILLNNLDAKIEILDNKLQMCQNFKKYLMQQIFTQKLRFKNDKQWNVYLLRNFINEYNERMGNKSNLPILSSTLNGIFLQNEYFNKSVSSKDVKNYKIVPNGYFTYRSMSDTGKFRFNIQSIVEVGIISPAYPVFSTQNIDDYFLYYYLNNSNFIKKQILSLKEGGTRYALSFSKFKKLKISLPSLEEQEKIANFLSAVDKKIDLIQTQIQKMEEFKKGLLQQMFVVQLILLLLQNKKHI